MKKMRIIAIIAAVIAGIGIYFFLKEVSKPKVAPHTDVVFAVVDIPENTMITEEMLELRPLVDEDMQESYLLDIDSAVGHAASGDIFANEPLNKNRLVLTGELDETNSLAYVVENGMRAVSISVNSVSGIENLIKPGNRVDLIVNYNYKVANTGGENSEEQRATKFLLQNRKVLASGTELSKEGSKEYVTLTLETTPEEAIQISCAESIGTIKVILRSSLDNEKVPNKEVDINVLRGEAVGK